MEKVPEDRRAKIIGDIETYLNERDEKGRFKRYESFGVITPLAQAALVIMFAIDEGTIPQGSQAQVYRTHLTSVDGLPLFLKIHSDFSAWIDKDDFGVGENS